MSFFRRILRLIKQKANTLLQRAEDPVEMLDLLDVEYVRDLTKMRKHIAEVLTAEKRLELEMVRVRDPQQHNEIECAHASVRAQRKELEAIVEEMLARLEALRVRRQTARAESAASRALIAARDWMLPLSSAGLMREESLERAREALSSLRCRSQALSQLRLPLT